MTYMQLIVDFGFILSAVKSAQFPDDNLPEIVFVGRSNVGKSSILNALLNRKNLAYVGNTPGKTREINFFRIDNQLYFELFLSFV